MTTLISGVKKNKRAMRNWLKGNAFEQPDLGPTRITRIHGKYSVRKQSSGTAEQCLWQCSDLFLFII